MRTLIACAALALATNAARADAPACRVAVDGNAFDTACLPALSKDGHTIAAPLVDPDGGRGTPNLDILFLATDGGPPSRTAVAGVSEVNELGGQLDGAAAAKLKPRVDALNRQLAAGGYAPLRALEVEHPQGPAAVQRQTLTDGALSIRIAGPRIEVERAGAKLATFSLPAAQTGKCKGANGPFVDGLWLAPSAPWLLARAAFRGNDSCSEPTPVYRLIKLDRAAPSAGTSPSGTPPGADATQANERGMALYHQKRYADAIKEFTSAIEAEPSYVKAHYNLACTAALAHDTDLALHQLEWLADSDDPEAAAKLVKAETDPDLASLRASPDFARATKRRPKTARPK